AVTEAIEKAVLSLIVEGVRDNLWAGKQTNPHDFDTLIANYKAEEKTNTNRLVGNKFPEQQRGKMAVFGYAEAFKIKGDYINAKMNLGGKAGVKYFLNDYINAEAN